MKSQEKFNIAVISVLLILAAFVGLSRWSDWNRLNQRIDRAEKDIESVRTYCERAIKNQ